LEPDLALLIGLGSQIGYNLVGRFPDPSDFALRALVRAGVAVDRGVPTKSQLCCTIVSMFTGIIQRPVPFAPLLAHSFLLNQAKLKKSTVTTLAQIMPTTKGFPELSKSDLSLSISDTNAERTTNKTAQMPSMPRKIFPSHFFEVRGFLAALVSAAGSGGSSPGTHGAAPPSWRTALCPVRRYCTNSSERVQDARGQEPEAAGGSRSSRSPSKLI
jgi:hypothetical protein